MRTQYGKEITLEDTENPDWTGVLVATTIREASAEIEATVEEYPGHCGVDRLVHRVRFSSGARLYWKQGQTADDFFRYVGHQYDWVGVIDPENMEEEFLDRLKGLVKR